MQSRGELHLPQRRRGAEKTQQRNTFFDFEQRNGGISLTEIAAPTPFCWQQNQAAAVGFTLRLRVSASLRQMQFSASS